MRVMIVALVLALTACGESEAMKEARAEVQAEREERRLAEEAKEERLRAWEAEHGVTIATMCEHESRMYEDVRTAWARDGDPDTFTDREKAYRQELMDKLNADFAAMTGGPNYEDVYLTFVTLTSKNGGTPCR